MKFKSMKTKKVYNYTFELLLEHRAMTRQFLKQRMEERRFWEKVV